MSDNTPHKNDKGSQTILIVVGAVLVIVGLANLGDIAGVQRIFAPFGSIFTMWRTWALALGAIVGGVLLIVAASRGGVSFRVPTRSDRLYRSRTDKMVAGVVGGLAEFFGMESTLLRLAIVALALLTDAWPVVIAYLAAAIIVPQRPESGDAA